MANNLLKWWRTKFLNGYKQFSVVSTECSEGKISDTEELLGKTDEELGRNSTTTPPPVSQNKNTPQEQKPLNLENFSCDVSLEGGLDESGQERQEFTFTLYDFDGHRKITKDDIAGLVTTIYEKLGSSVKVPHYGSKTIKVKLTVSSDQRKHVSATVIDHKPFDLVNNAEDSKIRCNRDLNESVGESPVKTRHCNKQRTKKNHYCCKNFTPCQENEDGAEMSDCSDVCSQLSTYDVSEDEEGECSEDHVIKFPTCNNRHKRRYQKHSSPKYRISNNQIKEQQDICTKAQKKKRSSSLQRQELLEIIQANMDKNNLTFQTNRKPCLDHNVLESKLSPQVEKKHHKHNYKVTNESSVPFQYLANMMDATHCYIDLANLQATAPSIPPSPQKQYCGYDKLLVYVSNKQSSNARIMHPTCRSKRHYRSRSHDLSQIPFRYHLLERQFMQNDKNAYLINGLMDSMAAKVQKKQKKRSKSHDIEFEQSPYKKPSKKFPQMVLGHTSSPHHLRHRNRQEDQARAMAQVVRWLEQEFSSNLNTNVDENVKNSKQKKYQSASWSSASNNSPKSTAGDTSNPNVSNVERHEHHHVHEHIHHHYHHYKETPVVV